MTTNTNTKNVRTNASHANCSHDATKSARAKCRREMRANTSYDAMRVDVNVKHIDAYALIANARANNDVNQMTIDDVVNAS